MEQQMHTEYVIHGWANDEVQTVRFSGATQRGYIWIEIEDGSSQRRGMIRVPTFDLVRAAKRVERDYLETAA